MRASIAAAMVAPARAVAQTEIPALRVACTANSGYAGAYYAHDAGFFTRAGLDVDVQTLSTGAAITAAVASGAVDIGITNVLPLAAAVEHGIPLLYICAGGLVNPDELTFWVRDDSGIRTGKDLEGKTIAATSLDNIIVVASRAWVDQAGGDSAKLRFVELPFSEVAAALHRGTIDAGPINEPALSEQRRQGALRGLHELQPPLFSVFGPHAMVGGWFARDAWIEANRETARRFRSAIYAAATWADSHGDESATILAKYAKMDPAVVKMMNRSPLANSLGPGMIQKVLDLAFKYRALHRRFAASSLIARL